MKLLVTGGSGFTGTKLVTYCLRHAIDVANVDWNPPLDMSNHTGSIVIFRILKLSKRSF